MSVRKVTGSLRVFIQLLKVLVLNTSKMKKTSLTEPKREFDIKDLLVMNKMLAR